MTTPANGYELLLEDLRERIASGRAVAIVGAGVAMSATCGNALAGWRGLLENGVHRCEQVITSLPKGWGESLRGDLKSGDIDDLLGAAQKVESKLKRVGEFARWLEDTVGQLQMRDGSVIDALCELRIPIMTTNYDGLIEKRAGVSPATWREPTKYERVLQGDRGGVLHLHGFYEDTESVVLGVSSYEAVLRDEYAQAMQKAVRALHTMIFIGYGQGLEDPNFSALLGWSTRLFGDSTYRHYRLALAKDVAQIQNEHDPKERVFVLPYGEKYSDLAGFLRSLTPTKDSRRVDAKLPSPPSSGSSAGAIASRPSPPDLKDYLAAIKAAHGLIKFVEIPLYEDTPDIEIDKLYVEPSVAKEQILVDRAEAEWPSRHDIGTVLAKRQCVVVLGDPGYGKSTLTSCLSWRLCNSGDGIPIPMIVRELNLKADLNWEGLLDAFLQHRIGKLLGKRDVLEGLLRDGRAVIFLDGLDEIGNLIIRRKLREAVHDGMSQYQSAKWIITSRIVGYDQVPFHIATTHTTSGGKGIISDDFKANSVATVYYLAPFASSQIKEFAKKWYDRHESDANLAHDRAEAFIAAINDNPGTKRLARVPYLLTLMALIHRKAASLPHGRTDLYDRISAAYLESIDVKRELDQLPYSLSQKKRWLAEAGFQMQLRRTKKRTGAAAEKADILAREDEVCEWLCKAMGETGAEKPKEEAKNILDYFAHRSGLLVPRGEGLFAFMHLSLQEYFAACYLEPRLTASRFAKSQRSVPTDKQLHGWANQTEWLEVYVLLFELLARKDPADTEDFFAFLFENRFKPDDPTGQNIAARLLAELVVDPFVNLTAGTRRRGRNMCWHAVFRDAFTAESGRRAISSISAIAQLMLSDCKGDLRKAWESAGLIPKELRDTVLYLNLSGCTGITDVEPLAILTQLKVLSLSGCLKLSDIAPLAKLKKLTGLNIDRCTGIEDLSPLSHLKQLEVLSMTGCGNLVDLSALAPLKKLTTLSISHCTTFDALQPIASMSKLRELSIDQLMAPVNFAYLLKCPALQELFIGGSRVSQDLSPLAQHPKLRSVHFHEFPPDIDLTPFAVSASAIQRICLAGTHPNSVPRKLAERGILNPATPTRRVSRKRNPPGPTLFSE